MNRIWTRVFSLAIIGLLSLTVVADVSAGHRRRRRGSCGCGGSDYGYAPGYYGGNEGYGYNTKGYGTPYAGGYGGATYTQPAPAAAANVNQAGVVGTANANIETNDRSARTDAGIRSDVPSNSDIRASVPQGSINAGVSGNADANLPATTPVAP